MRSRRTPGRYGPSSRRAGRVVLDRLGLAGAANAAAMAFWIFFVFIALSLARRMSNGNKHEDTVQDCASLTELSLVTLSALLWVPTFVVATRGCSTLRQRGRRLGC